MDAGNGENARDLDPQLVTHLNLQPLAIDLSSYFIFLQVSSYVERQKKLDRVTEFMLSFILV